jgi:hypothetical protein
LTATEALISHAAMEPPSDDRKPAAPPAPNRAKSEREARLAKALRENLRRRKAAGPGAASKD